MHIEASRRGDQRPVGLSQTSAFAEALSAWLDRCTDVLGIPISALPR
jgi:hypothetical protein